MKKKHTLPPVVNFFLFPLFLLLTLYYATALPLCVLAILKRFCYGYIVAEKIVRLEILYVLIFWLYVTILLPICDKILVMSVWLCRSDNHRRKHRVAFCARVVVF